MNELDTSRPPTEEEIGTLVNAFTYFNEAASSLNLAYQRLQEKLVEVNRELDAKDREIYSRVRELDRVSRYLHSLLESVSLGVVAIDMEGNITILNRAAARMTGTVSEEAIHKPYSEVLQPTAEPFGALRTLLYGPELKGVVRDVDGVENTIVCQTNWVVDSRGERIGVIELMEDTSELRRLEHQVEQQRTLAALGEMAAAVAHEVRNPLSGIGGFAAILQEELAGQERLQGMAEKILRGVENLNKVATNLLFLTRQSSARPEECDIPAIIQDVVSVMESEAKASKVNIVFDVHLPRERVNSFVDTALFRLVLTNLLRNAMQAVDRKGRIEVNLVWMLLANRMQLAVSDNGAGIAQDVIPKLFNPFFTTKQNGTGLGLALVKKAINLLNGEIQVVSKEGEGATFLAIFPIRDTPYA